MKRYSSYKNSGVEWIGDIPSHWDKNRIKHIVNYLNGYSFKSDDFDKDYDIPVLRISDVGDDIDFTKCVKVKSIFLEEKSEFLVKKDDVLIGLTGGTIGKSGRYKYNTPSLLNQRVGLLRNTNKVLNGLLYYYVKSEVFIRYILFDCYGGGQDNIGMGDILQMIFPLPPISEQKKIVEFLDDKTQKIDTLIQNKEKKIELLKEKRTSLINHVVTKSLNPNVKMKDSGVEWIGEIPNHWGFVKVGHYNRVVRGGSPRPSGDPRFFNGDFIHWITVKDVTSKVDKYVVTTESKLTEEGMYQSRVLEPETLVLTNSGVTLGIPGILKIKGCINDGSIGFLDMSPKVERDFLYYFWTTQTLRLLEQQSGYGQPNLNIDIVSNVRFPLPSINEQKEIVKYLDEQTKEIEDLIQLEQKKIELLKEYRQSLISELVTGKVRVCEEDLSEVN